STPTRRRCNFMCRRPSTSTIIRSVCICGALRKRTFRGRRHGWCPCEVENESVNCGDVDHGHGARAGHALRGVPAGAGDGSDCVSADAGALGRRELQCETVVGGGFVMHRTNVCRFCKEVGWSFELIKYGTRAYAHPKCFVARKSVKELATLPDYEKRK